LPNQGVKAEIDQETGEKVMKTIIMATLFVTLLVTHSSAETFKVALFTPKGDSPFWTLVAHFAAEAASDLGLELQLYDAKLNHLAMQEQVKAAVTGADKVDAIVFSNFKKTAPKLIKIAEEVNVFAFVFNAGLGAKAQDKMGGPREKFHYWIGEMLPDDEGTAMAITDLLIDDAKGKGKVAADGKVHVIGIGGMIADSASIVRVNGLKKAMRKRRDAMLHQVVSSDWGAKTGKRALLGLLRRYPQTTAVWSASYRIANGIMEGLREQHLTPGKDIMTNSLILHEEALKAVKSGELVVTAGGHYIEGAWVMVLLYDYLHGIDFAEENIRMRSPMGIVTKDNVDLYLKKLTEKKLSKENLRKIDFTQYSKKLNPGLKKYQFSLDSILNQL
jgi:ABC-type sugar transport system substrate-binding protein